MGGKAPAGSGYELGTTFLPEDQSFSMKKMEVKTNRSNLFPQEMRRLKCCLNAMSKHNLVPGSDAQPRCPSCLLYLQGCPSLACPSVGLSREKASPLSGWH